MDDTDILLVEDNPGDVHLIERAFDDRELPGAIRTVKTGRAALDWLNRNGEYGDAPFPDVVLLDLNLPETSGHSVLDAIKSDARLKHLPVIVLTGSDSETELTEAYENGANAVVTKPPDPETFADRIQALTEFWLTAAVLPRNPDSDDE